MTAKQLRTWAEENEWHFHWLHRLGEKLYMLIMSDKRGNEIINSCLFSNTLQGKTAAWRDLCRRVAAIRSAK